MVTGEMVEELILSGADIIKVGIGPGRLCCGGDWVDCALWRGPGRLCVVEGTG